MNLFGALLAIPVLAMLLVQWTGFQEARVQDAQEVAAGRNLVVLGRAVERHVHANFDGTASLRGTVGAGGQLPIATLVAADLLPAGFSGAGDPMKRAVGVRVLDAGGGRLRVVSMQLVEAGDDRRPDAGVFEARAGWLGVVDGSGRLGAAGLGEDLSAFRNPPGNHPRENALVLYQEFDRENVCGDFLFRTARAGCPDAGRMETDLDLGGNDVTGVARLEADRLEVATEVAVGGDFSVGGQFSIGRSMRVEGTFSVPAGLTFTGDAEFTGQVNADAVQVTGRLEADSAEVGQDVTAGSVTASGNVTATGVTSRSSLNAASGYIRTLRVGSCTGC